MKRILKLGLLFALLLTQYNVFAGDKDTIVIAITKFDSKGRDTVWLKHYSTHIKFVNLYNMPLRQAITAIKTCHALLITGGEDVDPVWYNKGNDLGRCGSLDKRRDTLEMAMIDMATRFQLPVLGICRGEQILNVAKKGSLIIDIPTDIGTKVRHNEVNGKKSMHMVKLDKKSRLYAIILQDSGLANSSHHQCVEKIAPGFNRVAKSADGMTEAIEINNTGVFIVGVQWHPEDMPEKSPFARNLGKAFIQEAGRNLALKHK